MDQQQYELVLRSLMERFDHRATISFGEAAATLSFPSVNAAYIARRRNTFPVRVDTEGGLKVAVAELARYLVTGQPVTRLAPLPKRGSGRPTKKATVLSRTWSLKP